MCHSALALAPFALLDHKYEIHGHMHIARMIYTQFTNKWNMCIFSPINASGLGGWLVAGALIDVHRVTARRRGSMVVTRPFQLFSNSHLCSPSWFSSTVFHHEVGIFTAGFSEGLVLRWQTFPAMSVRTVLYRQNRAAVHGSPMRRKWGSITSWLPRSTSGHGAVVESTSATARCVRQFLRFIFGRSD